MNFKRIFLPVSAVFFVTIFASIISPIEISSASTAKFPAVNPIATPKHISIPKALVNAPVIDVGITEDGKMDVPNNYTQTGWYKYGTLPGKIGSAVIDGHVDDGGKIPGPFKNLKKVKAGDDIYVTMSDGSILKYFVLSADVYKTDSFPGEKVFHESGKAYLKIITCHGKWVAKKNTYDQRLVVKAVLASTKLASL